MTEKQNVEYKISWRDEFLKWICGFANAQGGTMIIGANDNGDIAGLPDAAKLLEDIPNKVKDILGIMVDVNLQTESGKDYLEVKVDPYPTPISYKGQYHYRSGRLDKHASQPYNPDIANTFFRAGYIESWGRGLVKIRTECTDVGLPEPTFTFNRHGLMVHFKGRPEAKTSGERRENVGETSGEIGENVGDASGRRREEVGKTSGRILELIKDNPEITIPELASNIGVSERSIERNIQKLQKDKLLIRIGASFGGRWEVLE